MTFDTPQADIDRCLEIENAVTPGEKALYLECMNGRPLSQRIAAPRADCEPGRDVRDGCILTGVFLMCRPTPEPEARPKSKRTRIKEHRSKRESKRFYAVVGGKERARDTGVKA